MPMTFKLSAGFGELTEAHNTPHTGIDIPMEVGTKLRSIADGVVERVVDYGNQNIGKGVIIRTIDGKHYIYGHLSQITVHNGDHVNAGVDIIGLSGNSGHSTGPHLHFGIQSVEGHFIDPTPLVDAVSKVSGGDPFGMYVGDQPMPGTALDWLNKWGDHTVTKQNEMAQTMLHPVQGHLMECWHWTVANLPDIMGYGAIIAGICIILGAMIGNGRMIKYLATYAGMLLLAALIRSGT